MKNILTIAICIMIFLIGCNVETNTMVQESNYLYLALIPVLALTIYARFNLKEFENED